MYKYDRSRQSHRRRGRDYGYRRSLIVRVAGTTAITATWLTNDLIPPHSTGVQLKNRLHGVNGYVRVILTPRNDTVESVNLDLLNPFVTKLAETTYYLSLLILNCFNTNRFIQEPLKLCSKNHILISINKTVIVALQSQCKFLIILVERCWTKVH